MPEEFLNEAVEWEQKAREAAISGEHGYALLCANHARHAFNDALESENENG